MNGDRRAVDLRHISFRGEPVPRRVGRPSGPAARSRPLPPTPGDEFAAWVLRRAGLDPGAYRSRVFARRMPSCLRLLRAPSIVEARAAVEQRAEALPDLLSTLLIGVTEFFRDPDVFGALKTTVVPHLRVLGRPPAAWSAACSSGAELYSVAMLLDEAGLLRGARLLGTDCREDAIADAARALFAKDAARSLPLEYRFPYVTDAGGGRLRPIERIRAAPHWRVADLNASIEPGPWDLVLWRNAAIYLEAAAADRAYRRIAAELRPGGFLVLGKAERPPRDVGLVPIARCVYEKPGGIDGC